MSIDDLLLEREARHYEYAPDKYICSSCIGDTYMKNWIEENAQETCECSYCGKNAKCVSMDSFMDKIMEAVEKRYGQADEVGAGWDSEDKEYTVPVYDKYNFVWMINDYLQGSDEVQYELENLIDDIIWCERDPYGIPNDKHELYSWHYFSNVVKSSSRYFFEMAGYDRFNELLSPMNTLDSIASTVKKLGLIKEMPVGEKFYRAHSLIKNEKIDYTSERLGAPPSKKAKANRMSAAGISVFYGTDDIKTAMKEVLQPNTDSFVIAEFSNSQKIKYLDLTGIKNLTCPSFFDIDKSDIRDKISFLYELDKELVKYIDSNEHIEYVPTQVFAEYFRTFEQIDGIKYNSAKGTSGACVVLFFDNEMFKEKSINVSEQKIIYNGCKGYKITDILYKEVPLI